MRWIGLALAFLLGLASAQAAELTIGVGASIATMDPHFFNSGPNDMAAAHFFEPLIRQDERQRLRPALAVGWRALDDTHWEIKLRPGVRFSDGTPFGAEDVLASFRRVRAVPNSPSSFVGALAAITDAEAVDPLTLRLVTAKPAPVLPADLSSIFIVNRAMEHATTADFNAGKAMIGTGPYVFRGFVPGDHLTMRRNDAYWAGPEPWSAVTLRILTNSASRLAALYAGDVDAIDGVPPGDLPTLRRKKPEFTLVSSLSDRVMYLAMDQERAQTPFATARDGTVLPRNPFRDLRVRRAISKAIDRAAIAATVMAGQAVPAGQLLPAGFFGTSPTLQPDSYDPEAARRLLAEAGYPDGFRVTLHGPNDRYINDGKILQAIGQMLSAVGIETEVRALPFASYVGRAAHQEFSLFLFGWGSDTGEASSPLRALVAGWDPARGLGAANRGRYRNAEVDAAIERAMQTIDDDRRAALLRKATEIAIGDLAIIPLHFEVSTWAMRRGLTYIGRTDQETLAMGFREAP